MATSSIQAATTAIQDLAKTITKRFDSDGDGRLSSDEFTGFLTQFLGSMESSPAQTTPKTSVTSAIASATTLMSVASSAERKAIGTMAGFDAVKLANESHNSAKYQIGRILQYYPHTPAGLKDALPELQQIVPGIKITGSKGDKLDFGGWTDPKGSKMGVVDVIQAAGAGGTAWQWAPE